MKITILLMQTNVQDQYNAGKLGPNVLFSSAVSVQLATLLRLKRCG